jgi:hypothetical protein
MAVRAFRAFRAFLLAFLYGLLVRDFLWSRHLYFDSHESGRKGAHYPRTYPLGGAKPHQRAGTAQAPDAKTEDTNHGKDGQERQAR